MRKAGSRLDVGQVSGSLSLQLSKSAQRHISCNIESRSCPVALQSSRQKSVLVHFAEPLHACIKHVRQLRRMSPWCFGLPSRAFPPVLTGASDRYPAGQSCSSSKSASILAWRLRSQEYKIQEPVNHESFWNPLSTLTSTSSRTFRKGRDSEWRRKHDSSIGQLHRPCSRRHMP